MPGILSGFSANARNGIVTVMAVAFAPTAFASPIPWQIAFLDSSDPSVAMRTCLNILCAIAAVTRRWDYSAG
jgi:hypothetical protein